MIRRHLSALRLALMFGDGVIAGLVFLFVSFVRFGEGEAGEFWQGIGIDIRVAAILFAVAWVSAMWFMRLYQLRLRWSLLTEARDITRTMLLLLVLTLAALFVVNEANVSRLFLAALFLSQPIVTLAGRVVIRYWFGALRGRGYNTRYMLIGGTGTLAQAFADRVEDHVALGIRVIGHLSVPGEPDGAVSRPILGNLDEIEAVFRTHVVDEVAVCLPPTAVRWMDPVAELAAKEGKIVRIPFDQLQEIPPNAHEEEFDGFVVRSLVHDDRRELGLAVKRLIDIAGSTAGLVVLSPLLLVTALLLWLREGSPVLFRQTRVGLNGRPFTIYKFRTMVADAEARYAEVEAQSDIKGAAFKMTNDPRVTSLGRTLRSTSLDELPQLWNVLRGDMSLVGPRPAPPREVDGYDIWHRRRLSMKPGVTGPWQVEARLDEHFDQRATMDIQYIDHWSLVLDFKILVRTIPAVLVRSGR